MADYSPVGESAIFVESMTQHRASPKMNKTPSDNNLIIESNKTIYNAAYNTRSGRSNTDEEIYVVIQLKVEYQRKWRKMLTVMLLISVTTPQFIDG